MNQLAIPPLAGFVRKEYLYDMAPEYLGQWAPCTVVGICSYKGELPTLKLIVNDGSLWDYIPFDAFSTCELSCNGGSHRKSLTPDACPAHEATFQTFPVLAAMPVKVWFAGVPNPGPHPARYIGTVDWPDANYSGNLVQYQSQLALVPNYRMVMGEDTADTLPKGYKKLHAIFT